MKEQMTPSYAVFDDYRATQRILVWARWVIIAFTFYATNIRPTFEPSHQLTNNLIIAGEALLNAYLHWQTFQGKRLSLPTVVTAGLIDAGAGLLITSISETPAFANPYYAAFFPIVLAYSLVLPRNLALLYSFGLAGCYGALSLTLGSGISLAATEEKILVGRVLMLVVAGVMGTSVASVERTLRRQAVEAERHEARENLELERRAQQAELAAQVERTRIAREIHDGIAQSIYMLSLNLEAVTDLFAPRDPELGRRLHGLVKLSKQTLLETRHYIFDLKPMLSGDTSLAGRLGNLVREYEAVTSIPAAVSVTGVQPKLPMATAASLYRVAQEALANTYKHAHASRVQVLLDCSDQTLHLSINDDGRGFSAEVADATGGYGLQNMRQRVQELGGELRIESQPGEGTTVQVDLPLAAKKEAVSAAP